MSHISASFVMKLSSLPPYTRTMRQSSTTSKVKPTVFRERNLSCQYPFPVLRPSVNMKFVILLMENCALDAAQTAMKKKIMFVNLPVSFVDMSCLSSTAIAPFEFARIHPTASFIDDLKIYPIAWDINIRIGISESRK